MNIWTGIGIFCAMVLLIEGSYAVLRILNNPEKKRVRQRLEILSYGGAGYENERPGIERQKLLSEVPWLHRVLSKFRWTPKMNLLLEQSGVRYRLGFFVLLSAILPAVGFLAGSWVPLNFLILLPIMAFLACLPFSYVYYKKTQRMKKFESQLPEAMELMARALKAGHAFSGALKMVVDELDDPIALEFSKTLGEINLGVNVSEALKNLSNRVDCTDLRFFVISVIIQRETGGNLAEILENIAHLIRERFKLHGRIRVLSAEGKFSAIVLIGIPFLVALILSILNPKYIQILMTDPLGNILVGLAVFLMIVGVAVMKRMIVIRV
jgi:tight adherence protein B